MNDRELRALLEEVKRGTLSPETAEARVLDYVREAPFEDLGFARVDHHRVVRQGFPEVIFGPGKTTEQVVTIAERIVAHGHSLLVTRTTEEVFEAIRARLPAAQFHCGARAVTLRQGDVRPGRGTVLVAAAGTSDLPVADEAAVTAEMMGNAVDRLYDVGVAGLHRLLAVRSELRQARVVIVVAGMDGALPSVVGGLVAAPVIAVPTSIGYGAHLGGLAPLLTMLNSCAPGVLVVNIDNGYGAAVAACRIVARSS